MVLAIAKEIEMRKDELKNELIETIYFGGGTPSILDVADIEFLLNQVYKNYTVIDTPEITLEANPDDLYNEKLMQLASSPINRLSIGIQSFFEDDLKMMNRAHNAAEALNCLKMATEYFDNISIDLIYGIPEMSNERWTQNIKTALSFGISHISSYALTVEPKTALHKFIKSGKMQAPKDDVASNHFDILVNTLEKNGFIHYELSNFGKENYFSKNNSNYWLGKKYIGIGPSAHSFDGLRRSWNCANNTKYIKSIQNNELPNETEVLSITDKYNEYVMTGLRTIWGVSAQKISDDFGEKYHHYFLANAQKSIAGGFLIFENNILKTTKKGKFLCDGLASDLFMINDK